MEPLGYPGIRTAVKQSSEATSHDVRPEEKAVDKAKDGTFRFAPTHNEIVPILAAELRAVTQTA